MIHRRTLLVLLALLMVASGGLLVQPVQGQTNLLTNPGFEDPYTPFQGDTTRMVANGWSAWHVPQREGDEGFRNLKPEYQPASASNPDRILSGANAQEYFSFFATHTGGVYQQVTVPAGSEVAFSVSIYVWSTSGTNVNSSTEPGHVQVQVGIDPNGGTDGESERIIWSVPLEYYDNYQQVSVSVKDVSSRVTVFVRTTFDLPQKNNNVYLDNASLTIIGSAAPTSTATRIPSTTPRPSATTVPAATSTPLPSATPAVVVTSTPLPSATPPGIATNTLLPGLATPTQESHATEEAFATATSTLVPTTSGEFPYRFTYVVVAGDTVGALAQRFESSIAAIIAANGLNSDGLIFVDQALIIPVRVQPTPTITPTYSMTELGFIPTSTPVGMAPTAAPTATPAPAANTVTYVVQRGDTLTRIATRYGTTAAAITQRNGILNPNLILVGQQLVIPVVGQPQPPAPTPAPQPQPGATTHVVQPGENLYRISLRYGIPVNTLARLNGIYNVNRIFVGQVIRLR